MFIDVHVHTFPDAIAERALEKLSAKTGYRLRPAGSGTLSGLVPALAAGRIDRAVLCPIATKPSFFEGILAESLAMRDGARGEDIRKHIIPLASVHPADEHRFEHLKKIAESGLKGIKLHPYYQSCVLDSPDMLEYFHCCRDLNLIVQCHCGFDAGFLHDPICGPERINRVLREVPGLTFIAAHLGGLFQWGGVAEHLLGKDVYLDTSLDKHSFTDPGALRIMREHPSDKLLFGTDWPWLSFADGIAFVKSVGLPSEAESAILGGNAAKLFSLC